MPIPVSGAPVAPSDDFVWSTEPEPHAARTRQILATHPEIRALIGRNPRTAALIVVTVALQFALAWALRDASWWMILGAAYTVGAVADHALFVMVHECAHNLVFPRTWQNQVAALVANLPQLMPTAISFRRYHLKHHAFQGVHELDADLPSRWEARLIRGWSIGKALWLLGFPLFQVARTGRLREIAIIDRWIAANWLVQLAVIAMVWWWMGGSAVAYLAVSFSCSIGLHPLGARWVQEHFLLHGQQETSSYYGAGNLVALNVGYHNEHHDFPSIPWNRLPQLRATAPEAYDALQAHHSWTRLLLRFLFDQEVTLFRRMVRRDRGRVRFHADPTPDQDAVRELLPKERVATVRAESDGR
jgi:sphingolipid delta-4 desaturase